MVLIVDRLDRLAAGVVIAKRARAIARQSVLLGMGLSLLGMGAAAVGLLAPVGGAVAQEVIDVLAIGSALRALRQPRSLRHTASVPDSWSHQLAGGHGPLRLVLEDLRSVAVAMDSADEATALTSLRDVAARISDEVVPHEREDESRIYPGVAERLGGNDPLAPMSPRADPGAEDRCRHSTTRRVPGRSMRWSRRTRKNGVAATETIPTTAAMRMVVGER